MADKKKPRVQSTMVNTDPKLLKELTEQAKAKGLRGEEMTQFIFQAIEAGKSF